MIINKIILVLAGIMVTILISGCDNTPSCSDGNVEELVIDMTNEKIEKDFILEKIGRKISIEELEMEMEELYKKLSNMENLQEKREYMSDNHSIFYAVYVVRPIWPIPGRYCLPDPAKEEAAREKILKPKIAEIIKEESLRKIVEKIIEPVKNSIRDTSLQTIRLDNKDDDLGKVQCKGQLKFANGNTHDIEYTAQNTEDGQLYVEVMGL